MEQGYEMDKLISEIFSILESKFLFGCDDLDKSKGYDSSPFGTAHADAGARVRILSVDAGGATEGLLAAASLALLESSLQHLTANTSVRIPDFFDVAAGSGIGGVLVSLIFSLNNSTNRPLYSAAEALRFLAKNHRLITKETGKSIKKGIFRRIFGGRDKRGGHLVSVFRGVFGDLTLRNTIKPVLIPCYDLATGAPFVFSRADALETDGYDFRIREVCAATTGMAAAENVRSMDGRTEIAPAAVDGGIATGNPTSTAITHVINNKTEFPSVNGVQDLFLVSIGNGEGCGGASHGLRQPGNATPSPAGIVKIAGDGVSDMIDQAVGMAFGQSRSTNYVRIQGRDPRPGNSSTSKEVNRGSELLSVAEEMLAQRNIESVLFQGKKLTEKTNAEKLDWAAVELVKESEKRKKSPMPVVVFKQGSPRSSSSSSSPISSSTVSP